MNESAELRFRYVFDDGGGVAAVDALTGQVLKLATAEETAAAQAQAMGRALDQAAKANPPTRPEPAGGSRTSGAASPATATTPVGGPPAKRDSAALDEAFGLKTRRPDPLALPVRGTSPSEAARQAKDKEYAERIAPAPRPGGDKPSEGRTAADDRLVKALDALAVEMRKWHGANGSAATVPGGPGGGSTVRPTAPKAEGEGVRDEGTDPSAKRFAASAGGSPARMQAAVGYLGAAVHFGDHFASVANTPFMSDSDRFWANANAFTIPGTNIGVRGLRNIQMSLQRYAKGIDRDQLERELLDIQMRQDVVRQPLFEFYRRTMPDNAETIQRARDVYGPVIPNPATFGPRPTPPKKPIGFEEFLDIRGSIGVREKPKELADLTAKYKKMVEDYEAQLRTLDQRQRDFDAALQPRYNPQVPRVALPSQRRDTLAERQQLEEATAILPAQDRFTDTVRDRRAAEARRSYLDTLSASVESELVKAKEEYDAAKKAVDATAKLNDGDTAKQKAAATLVEVSKRYVYAARNAASLDDDRLGARRAVIQAGYAEREATLDANRRRLTLFEDRESTARDQAARLADLGPGGREMALRTADLAREVGYENLPAEFQSVLRSAAPRTARVLAEQGGQQYQPEFKAAFPDEYRDAVPDITKQVDETRKAVRAAEEANFAEQAKLLLESVRQMADRETRYTEELKALIKKIEAEARQKNGQQ